MNGRQLVIDTPGLRRAVGWIGALLPVILVLRAGGLAPSLSDFYYTPARDLFVGLLLVISALLAAYRGYDTGDRACSAVAALALWGVALFDVRGSHVVHYASALIFFAAIAALCWRFGIGGYRRPLFRGLAVGIVLALASTLAGVPLLAAESAAVLFFGAAWLVKGRAFGDGGEFAIAQP